jgi:hypothetical protein
VCCTTALYDTAQYSTSLFLQVQRPYAILLALVEVARAQLCVTIAGGPPTIAHAHNCLVCLRHLLTGTGAGLVPETTPAHRIYTAVPPHAASATGPHQPGPTRSLGIKLSSYLGQASAWRALSSYGCLAVGQGPHQVCLGAWLGCSNAATVRTMLG